MDSCGGSKMHAHTDIRDVHTREESKREKDTKDGEKGARTKA